MFRYLLYYNQKKWRYILFDRLTFKIIYQSLFFSTIIKYIKDYNLDTNKIKFKSISLYELERDFITFKKTD